MNLNRIRVVIGIICFSPFLYALRAQEEDLNQLLTRPRNWIYGTTTEHEVLLSAVEDTQQNSNLDGKEPSHHTPPDICQDASLDTIERTHDGNTYAFKGDYYWKINYNVTANGYPRKISDDWNGLEGNLDASLTFQNGTTYFFKGSHYWSFTNKEMDPGYPKLISEGFRGIPDNLDAAIVWSGNGKPYFFKGKDYWLYDVKRNPHVSDEYPKPVTGWKGLPEDGVDAACVWENNMSYFFKGGLYYRFDDANSVVSANSPPYPYPTAVYWFSCPFRTC